MATLTADVYKIIEKLVDEIRTKRDIYASIYISFNGVNVSIYAANEESEE